MKEPAEDIIIRRAGYLGDAVRLVGGESGDWKPQGRRKQQEWEEVMDALQALDSAFRVARAES